MADSVKKITTAITPLAQTDKINEIIDALNDIQVSAGAGALDGGTAGDEIEDIVDGGTAGDD